MGQSSRPQPRLAPLRRFAIRYVNPATRLIAGWAPGFAMLTYRGRSSGRTLHTPINVFRRGGHYLFALTYGSEAQWVKNVFAAGACDIRHLGRDVHLVEPELIVDPELKAIRPPTRWFLTKVARVTEIVRMRAEMKGR